MSHSNAFSPMLPHADFCMSVFMAVHRVYAVVQMDCFESPVSTEIYDSQKRIGRWPLCRIALDENSACPKCRYKK